jgi:hypothetical protein
MNRRAIEALQVVDAMQNGGLDVPSIGNVATDGGKFERLCVPLSSRKKMGFAATPCFAGRAIRLKPFPCHPQANPAEIRAVRSRSPVD